MDVKLRKEITGNDITVPSMCNDLQEWKKIMKKLDVAVQIFEISFQPQWSEMIQNVPILAPGNTESFSNYGNDLYLPSNNFVSCLEPDSQCI